MKRCIGSAKPHRAAFRFFARYYDAEEGIDKRISWNWENISKCGRKFWSKITKNWTLNERCIGSPKPHRSVFRFFARYYDGEEVIHKRISWSWEDISNSAPKLCQNYNQMNLQWKGASDPQNLTEPFFIFLQDITMLKNWFISTFPEMEKISQNVGPN